MHSPCRYQEAYERDWRQKEKQARERAAAINSDLAEAREAQRAASMHLCSLNLVKASKLHL